MWKKRGNPIHFDRLSKAAGRKIQFRASRSPSVQNQLRNLFLFLLFRNRSLFFGDLFQSMALARLADEIAEQVQFRLVV